MTALSIAEFLGIAALAISMGGLIWNSGRLTERLTQAEAQIKELRENADKARARSDVLATSLARFEQTISHNTEAVAGLKADIQRLYDRSSNRKLPPS
jgi:septal ring factor EnvC (AmiA/AmiB activator)